ncbi:hypothetical protein Q8F55_006349 [Vanrija albida]|uniref:Uncharacterized protein n=1 Tax=Vanrija albida TaxID=181172 RepID=A0ABR3PX57_9TREE
MSIADLLDPAAVPLPRTRSSSNASAWSVEELLSSPVRSPVRPAPLSLQSRPVSPAKVSPAQIALPDSPLKPASLAMPSASPVKTAPARARSTSPAKPLPSPTKDVFTSGEGRDGSSSSASPNKSAASLSSSPQRPSPTPTSVAEAPEPAPASAPATADATPPTPRAHRAPSRRTSSPLFDRGMEFSMLGDINDVSLAASSVGDKTYDALEVAVEVNHQRRKSLGVGLALGLPRVQDEADDSQFEDAPVTRRRNLAPSSSGTSLAALREEPEQPAKPHSPVRSAVARLESKRSAANLAASTFLTVPKNSSPLKHDTSAVLLDGASFRLTPPAATPSSKRTPARSSRTPSRTTTSSRAYLLSTPANNPDATVDLGTLLVKSSKPKRPSGTEESFLAASAGFELADLSDDEVLPPSLRPTPVKPPLPSSRVTAPTPVVAARGLPPSTSIRRLAERYTESTAAAPAPRREVKSSAPPVMGSRVSTARDALNTRAKSSLPPASSRPITRSDSTRTIPASGSSRTLARSDSLKTMARSDSLRTMPRSDSHTALPRSDSARALPRSESASTVTADPVKRLSSRPLPASGSTRSLAGTLAKAEAARVPTTPRAARDYSDVPMTMRRAPKSVTSTRTLAPSTLKPSSPDRWADAVPRDPVVVAAARPSTTTGGITRSSSVRSMSSRPATTLSTESRTSRSSTNTASTLSSRAATSTAVPSRSSTAASLSRPGTRNSPSRASSIRSGSEVSAVSAATAASRVSSTATSRASSTVKPDTGLSRASKTISRSGEGYEPRSRVTSGPVPTTRRTVPASSRPLPSGMPKSASAMSLATTASSAITPAASRTLRPPTTAGTTRTLPPAAERIARPANPTARPLADAGAAANRRNSTIQAPGAGVALARTKLSAPPSPTKREVVAPKTRTTMSTPAATVARSSRPSTVSATVSKLQQGTAATRAPVVSSRPGGTNAILSIRERISQLEAARQSRSK